MSSPHKFPSFYFPSQRRAPLAGRGSLSSVAYLSFKDSNVEPIFRRLTPDQPHYSTLHVKPVAPALPIYLHKIEQSKNLRHTTVSYDTEVCQKIFDLGRAHTSLAVSYDAIDSTERSEIKRWRESYRRNCLGLLAPRQCRFDDVCAVLYPTGEESKVLDVCLLSFSSDDDPPIYMNSASWQTFLLGEIPLQVACSPLQSGKQGTVGLRSAHECAVFSSLSTEGLLDVREAYTAKSEELEGFLEEGDPQLMCGYDDPKLLTSLASFRCKSTIVDLSVSSYSVGETAMASASGAVHLWSPNATLETVLQPALDASSFQTIWTLVEFSAHPKQLFVGRDKNLFKLDCRMGRVGTSIIPSDKAYSDIRALCVHQSREFSVLYATDELVVLMDERYAREPLLAWEHDLESPPRSLDVRVCAEKPNGGGSHHVIGVTGSQRGDMGLFYYRDGVDALVNDCTVPAILNGGNPCLRLPAQTTGRRIDVSRPNEWIAVLDVPVECSPCHVAEDSAVIGSSMILCSKESGSTDNNDLVVLQLTALGHLYTQSFRCSVSNDVVAGVGPSSDGPAFDYHDVALSEETTEKIRRWAGENAPLTSSSSSTKWRKSRKKNLRELYDYSSSILNLNRCFSCWRKKLTSALPFSATSCSLCGQSLSRDTSSAREVDDDDEEQDIRQWRPIEKPKATQSRTTRNLWKLWNEDWEDSEEEEEYAPLPQVRRRGRLGRGIKDKNFVLSDEEEAYSVSRTPGTIESGGDDTP